jgi:predicted metal-dependent HD superfamily phosphohydrolase
MITHPDDLLLLKLACIYHDCGFLFTYTDHEAVGCDLVMKELPAYGLGPQQIDAICGMIMATKIPQNPLTKLEEIICDADLDYLGREDFFPISNNLYLELKACHFVSSENQWNLIQVKFFKEHRYFTATTKMLREQQKQVHLEMIEAMVLPV